MKSKTRIIVVILLALTAALPSMAQKSGKQSVTNSKATNMKTYVIERDIPKAGELTPEQLKGISKTSNGVLEQMGPKIEWLQSYVAGDKIYCVYKAENPELILEHAKKGGFPANKITEVAAVISPATGKQ